MAQSELAILVKAAGAIQAARDIGKVDSAVGKLGRTAGQGLKTAAANIGRLGLVAAGGLAIAVKGGLSSLAELESAVTSVDGAITQLGLTGQLTGSQVAGWANDIEASVGAAFDDKAITQAAATLLRFGKVTPGNLRPALVVMTDLATKTGDVDSAAALLAKALADPTKAAGKLARSGVVLTKEQQDQIKAMVKAGQTAQAQAFLLDQLSKATTGAAAASQGPYARSLKVLRDVTEDAQRALATGFLPVIEKVADLLGKELAKPSTLAGIKAFGETFAGGLDRLITAARGLPWASIGDSLHIAGMGAKAVFDAFMAMPPWVQTAVLTGWGLNKLTGGALGSIVGELGKGLIRGVLGINAAVVNINAASVNGGVPGVVPGGGVGQAVRTAAKWIIPIAVAAAVWEFASQAQQQNPNDRSRIGGRAGGIQPVSLEKVSKDAAQGLADQRAGERGAGRESTAAFHAFLDQLIGNAGGAFQREGAKAGTLDKNAGQLVELFRTSTNPSLKSMQDNLAIMKGLAGKGDPETRKALSGDIKALQALIDRKLAELIAATQALKLSTTGNAGWTTQRQGEININVTVQPTARDITKAITTHFRYGPMVPQ